jgi:hypothetical protein
MYSFVCILSICGNTLLWPNKILPQTFGWQGIHPYLCRPKSVLVRLSGVTVGFQWANPIIN